MGKLIFILLIFSMYSCCSMEHRYTGFLSSQIVGNLSKKRDSDKWNSWWGQVSWDEEKAKKPEKSIKKVTDRTCWTLFKKICKRIVYNLTRVR